nr:1843_t:CDS:2 [Entrophospora candida]
MHTTVLLLQSLTLTALGASLYLYYYTAFCGWKWKDSETRILFLADPQIEGESKIRRQGIRGKIDLFGNDLYLRHIYTSFVSLDSLFSSKPTHTIVLGDLFSSQWIKDKEFKQRTERYKWIFGDPKGEYNHKLINLTGNHDIGYSGDMNKHRVERWKEAFGEMNFIKKFHKLAIINSMNVDGPVLDEELHYETWSFLRKLSDEEDYRNTPLILLTHIPIHKEEGICVDGPMIVYNSDNTIKEQNHLSQNSSNFILTKLKPRFIFAGHDHEGCDVTHVIRLNDNYDSNNNNSDEYTIESFRTNIFESKRQEILGRKQDEEYDEDGNLKSWIVREVTVRSMMGGFSGNAGLFEIKKKISKKDEDYGVEGEREGMNKYI